MNITTFRVVPTPARLKLDPKAKPHNYSITWETGEKLLISIQTIVSLGYYIQDVKS